MRDVTLRSVDDRSDWRAFLSCQSIIQNGDPTYIRPLDILVLGDAHPKQSPFLKRNPSCAWIAWENGTPVGRVMAIHNLEHEEKYGAKEGHFGFFECVDDPDVAALLLNRAARWLGERGCVTIVGPYSPSINHETGLLIEGDGGGPTVGLNHAPDWYARLLEGWGLRERKRLIALLGPVNGALEPTMEREVWRMAERSKLRLERVGLSGYWQGVRQLFEIYNEGWAENWGSIPIAKSDRRHYALSMIPIYRKGLVTFVKRGDDVIAAALQIPNLTEIAGDAGGRLLPFHWAKILTRLRSRRVRHGRVVLLGVRPRWQHTRIAALAAMMLMDHARKHFARQGIETFEASWMLEDNEGVLALNTRQEITSRRVYAVYSRAIGVAE